MIEKQEKFDCPEYRRWVASLDCVISGESPCQAAHIRKGGNAGTGMKPPDWRCVPLRPDKHEHQHRIGELRFWYPYGGYETAAVLAYELYRIYKTTGHRPTANILISQYRARYVKKGAAIKNHKFVNEGVKGHEQ